MSKTLDRDDPLYADVLAMTLKPYIEEARKWWADIEKKTFIGTTTYPIENGPPGMFEKCVRSPRQSPIYGIQAFPIVSVSYLTLPKNMRGGAIHLIDHICKNGFVVDEFTLISKFGINSSHMNGFYLCIIPTTMLEKKPIARWVYLRPNEIVELTNGIVNGKLAERLQPFAQEYLERGDIT